jgi:hypothetical protein
VDNIKRDLIEIGCGGVDWTGLAQDTGKWRESSCESGNEPSGSIKYWETYEVATQLVVSRVQLGRGAVIMHSLKAIS